MPSKECNSKCRGRCNRRSLEAIKIDKACNPRCTGRCSKLNAETLTQVRSLNAIDKIASVIIDLDGVILDIETVYERVINEIVNIYKIPKSEAAKIIDLQDNETFKKFCADYKLPISPQLLMNEFKTTSIKHLAQTPLMPGIENLVNYFINNDIKVAVATTSNEDAYNLKTSRYSKLFRKFSHIVLGSDPAVRNRKPSPDLYNICASRFSTKPNPRNVLVLEDAPEGVVAANKAGMRVAWFPNKYMRLEDGKGAEAIYKSLKDFKPEVFGLPAMI